ncbi:MAG: DMT family transporter [Prevotellaceae bacterium]|jgi:drug/metabolite transporter (DMT)-like permease|nr:DMT family transporter [Prevotellaceae bacterium]
MDDKNLKGHTALLIAYVIFGLNTPITKAILTHGETSAMALTFYRFSGAAVLFWFASLFAKKERVPVRDIILLNIASLFAILINQMSFIAGLSMTSPIDASVITTLVPVMTMILAAFFLKEPITWKKVIGVFVGASGALLLIFNGNIVSHNLTSIEGNLLCMLSCFAFAIYLAAFKKLIVRYSAITSMKWMFLSATVCSLPFCWHDISAVNYSTIPLNICLRIMFVVIMATFISYLLIPAGQKLLRPTIVSMYNYLQPLVSSFVAVILGMDTFGWIKSFAALLIFFGVYIVTKSKSRAQIDIEKMLNIKQ